MQRRTRRSTGARDERYWEITKHHTLRTFTSAARRALASEDPAESSAAATLEERIVDVNSPRT